ncbi:MAG TPA: alpha/beta hydrolase [Syntrophales bacterium]
MINSIDYSLFDRPDILMALFYPRPEWSFNLPRKGMETLMIPVDSNVEIQAQVYLASPGAPNILFFHGNGEIAADYQEIAPFYTNRMINLIVVDYRGYGRSTGIPSVSSMMKDCHSIFAYFLKWLKQKKLTGKVIVMGRSLGSAPALEIAHSYQEEIDGLIIESGFAYAGPLLRLMGVDMEALRLKEEQGFRNVEKIMGFQKPTLVIHALYDHIIAFQEGEILFNACPAKEKRLLRIPGANHNNVFIAGMTDYMASIEWLVARTEELKP